MKRLFLTLVLVVLLISLSTYSYATVPSDVPQNHWAYEAIDLLIKEGIIKGYPDGTFRGNQNVTRYELAMLLAKLLELVKSLEKAQETIKEQTQTPTPKKEETKPQASQTTQKSLTLKRREIPSGAYTGLVIDARGKKVNRSLSPKIYDANGREIYGISIFTKENHSLEEYIALGVVEYIRSEEEITSSRAGSKPLIVKVIDTSGNFNEDFTVSVEDGNLILKENEISKFLEDMAVVILY